MKSLKWLIKKKFNFYEIIFLVFAIITIRIIFDFGLLEYPIELDIFQHYARFYLENIYFL